METILQKLNIGLWWYMFELIYCSIVSYNDIVTKSGNKVTAYE